MLVDLARNDLSRNGTNVKVEKNREIQFYSHVIHLVSKVTATLKDTAKIFQVVMDTFPAGTLTGAPKHKALNLIEKYEKVNRITMACGKDGLLMFSTEVDVHLCDVIDDVTKMVQRYVSESENDDGSRNIRT